MTDDFFNERGTSYRDIHQLVCFLVKQICRQYNIWEMEEDLISQGMLAAFEVLQKYESSRHTKATSYIFMHVKGRLRQYAEEYSRRRNVQTEVTESDACTDNSRELSGFEVDPYRMQPDIIYDLKRREHLVNRLEEYHAGEVEQYVDASHGGGNARERQQALRRRKRSVKEIRKTVSRILEKNATLSRITEVINLIKNNKK